MHILLTTKCNMQCAHCLWESSPLKQDFISIDTFRKALEFPHDSKRNFSNKIILSGGEPTEHPDFYSLLTIAKEEHKGIGPQVNTNGLNVTITLDLIEQAERGKIILTISKSKWHDTIDPSIEKALSLSNSPNIFIVNHDEYTISKQGAAKNILEKDTPFCSIPDTVCMPDGTIYFCGCASTILQENDDPAKINGCTKLDMFARNKPLEHYSLDKAPAINKLDLFKITERLNFLEKEVKQLKNGN